MMGVGDRRVELLVFLRGENPAVYAGSESDKSSTDHVLTLMRIFM